MRKGNTKSSTPTVSIVIPVLNDQEFLGRCINSAISQTSRPLEIIVSDNCSADESFEIARTFSSSVRVVQPPVQLAMFSHFNFAIQQASGEWVVLLSSDDELCPIFVEKMSKLAAKPNVALVRGGVRYVDSQGSSTGVSRLLSVSRRQTWPKNFTSQFCGPRGALCSTLFSHAAFDSVGGFDETLQLAADWALWLSLAPFGEFVRTSHIVSNYRSNYRSSLHAERITSFFDDYLKIFTSSIPRVSHMMNFPVDGQLDRPMRNFLVSHLEDARKLLSAEAYAYCIQVSKDILINFDIDPDFLESRPSSFS